jgi:hypothetical protein
MGGRWKKEAREILRQVSGQRSGPVNFGQTIHDRLAVHGDNDLPVLNPALFTERVC